MSSSPTPSGSSSPTQGEEAFLNLPSEDRGVTKFDENCTSLLVGSSTGFKVYPFQSIEELTPLHVEPLDSGDKVTIIERLSSTSLLAYVTRNLPRVVRIMHFRRSMEVFRHTYEGTILSVKMNKSILVVCLEDVIYICNLRNLKADHTVRYIPPNPKRLYALSRNVENCYIAFPSSVEKGDIQIYDAVSYERKLVINAHENPIAAFAFNPSGRRLATASERGTVIRIFSVETGSKLVEYRRGLFCASIHNLSFSPDGRMLALSSNTSTIHLFPISEQVLRETELSGADSWYDYFSSAVVATTSYLTPSVAEPFIQQRSAITITVPTSAIPAADGSSPNTVAFVYISKKLRLLMASSDGYLYIYDLPGDGETECTLVNQHKIDLDCSKLFDASCNGSPSSSKIKKTKVSVAPEESHHEQTDPQMSRQNQTN